MNIQDPIADFFVRIRNAQRMFKKSVSVPASKLKLSIARLLVSEGYLLDVQREEVEGKAALILYLKYHQGEGVIALLKRVSRPSCRVYRNAQRLPKVMGGLGVALVSTSKGVVSDRAARAMGQGGEVMGLVA